MRPVRRGLSPRARDFEHSRDARVELISRLGQYCSYCERHIPTQLAVEHIQPKSLPQYAALEGRWENFLLGCVNCNSTKLDKDVALADHLLPDRDNTFVAFQYGPDGTVRAASALGAPATAQASATLALVGLDKRITQALDANGKLVAIDRVAQRIEAWATAEEAKADVNANQNAPVVRTLVAKLAAVTGFFSVWMTVFANDADMRRQLIGTFKGTWNSDCFDPTTTAPVRPAPNPDGLPNGGKT